MRCRVLETPVPLSKIARSRSMRKPYVGEVVESASRMLLGDTSQ